MSIISELNKTKDYLRSSRDAVLARGGEISTTAGLKDLPDAIYNIPADSSLAFPTDDTVAYRKIVPVGVEGTARVTDLGGMTYKCNNLLNEQKYLTQQSGYNTYDESTGIWEASSYSAYGTSIFYLAVGIGGTRDITKLPKLPSNTEVTLQIFNLSWVGEVTDGNRALTIGLYNSSGENISYQNKVFTSGADFAFTFTTPNEDCWLDIARYYNVGYLTFEHLQIVVGSTALPYEPYFSGLRSAKVTSLKSEGANLIPFPYVQSSISQFGLTATANSDGSIHLSGTATEVGTFTAFFLGVGSIANFSLPPSTYSMPATGKYGEQRITVTFANKDRASMAWLYSTAGANTVTTTEEAQHLHLKIEYWIKEVGEVVDFTFYPTMNYGSTPAPFTPYRAEPIDTLAIPEAVQSLPDYGEGVSADYSNRIKFADKKYRQEVARVSFDGTEKWTDWGSTDTYNAYWTDKCDDIFADFAMAISNKFDRSSARVPNVFYIADGGSKTSFKVPVEAYPTVDDWKNQLAEWYNNGIPLIVVGLLADPIETDISAYLTSDGFFKVQGGGSIAPTEANGYEYTVPSTINYVQKVGT